MQNNLPFLQPGQRMIVRHRPNGDTEYICRQDDDLLTGEGCSNSFFLITVIVIILLVFFSDATQKIYEKRKEAQENIELDIAEY